MKLRFEPDLDFQLQAIEAICDLFRGQEICRTEFTVARVTQTSLALSGNMENDLGVGNRLTLPDDRILNNLNDIQLRNGLPPSASLDSGDFTVEMETGTGKTYVYLRTMLELNKRFGFTKFVIVVPSVAIKEGVYKSLQITRDHFQSLYSGMPYEYFLYDSAKLGQVRNFSTSASIQIMVVTVGAINKKAVNNLYKDSEKTGGERFLREGEAFGDVNAGAVAREMIRRTIREHLDKETRLRERGIKVLSLFFVDSVRHYRSYNEAGTVQKGDYARMFEEEYRRLARNPNFASLFEEAGISSAPEDVHALFPSCEKFPGAWQLGTRMIAKPCVRAKPCLTTLDSRSCGTASSIRQRTAWPLTTRLCCRNARWLCATNSQSPRPDCSGARPTWVLARQAWRRPKSPGHRQSRSGYIKNMLNAKKSIYDKVTCESETEKRFAEDLERNIAVKVYAKLPGWFKVPTPLGTYNPDWAVLINSESGERLYFVVETKGSTAPADLRGNELGKIQCGKKHFKALEVREPVARYEVATSLDDLLARA